MPPTRGCQHPYARLPVLLRSAASVPTRSCAGLPSRRGPLRLGGAASVPTRGCWGSPGCLDPPDCRKMHYWHESQLSGIKLARTPLERAVFRVNLLARGFLCQFCCRITGSYANDQRPTTSDHQPTTNNQQPTRSFTNGLQPTTNSQRPTINRHGNNQQPTGISTNGQPQLQTDSTSSTDCNPLLRGRLTIF